MSLKREDVALAGLGKCFYLQFDPLCAFISQKQLCLPWNHRSSRSQAAVPPFLVQSFLSFGLLFFSFQLDIFHGDVVQAVKLQTATPEEQLLHSRVQEQVGMPLAPLNI